MILMMMIMILMMMMIILMMPVIIVSDYLYPLNKNQTNIFHRGQKNSSTKTSRQISAISTSFCFLHKTKCYLYIAPPPPPPPRLNRHYESRHLISSRPKKCEAFCPKLMTKLGFQLHLARRVGAWPARTLVGYPLAWGGGPLFVGSGPAALMRLPG